MPAVQLLGTPTRDGAALPFERRSQLVAYLAIRRDWVQRTEVAALLWPQIDDRLAQANLRKTLFRLAAVPWAEGVEVGAQALRWAGASDVERLDEAVAAGRWGDAVALRRGELLAGFDDAANDAWTSWLRFERDRVQTLWRRAALAQLRVTGLDAAAALDLAAQLIAADPLDEEALRAQLVVLAGQGQTARARQAYREFAERLARELAVEPSAELRALHDALDAPSPAAPAPADEAAAAAARGLAATPEAAGFVGREAERRRIASMLAEQECRLVCLVGPGGAGKTRLARRALAELAPRWRDGGAFVALEDAASADELVGALARELGVAIKPGGSPALDRLVAALQPRQLLVVLDNFEQLAAHAGVLEALLAGCPRLALIVTSRVRLALASEWSLPIEGLPCAEDDDLDRIESFDASRLFIAAARRVAPALVPAAEAGAIAEICRRLDGLPLAIELAAAWTRVLGCAQIAAELRESTALLHATDATRAARHASVEAVFEQSWRLLGARERDALARLSVFRGGAPPDAARAVAQAPLPLVAALIDKSLVRRDGERWALHPLVQDFSAAKLDASGAAPAARSAHAEWFARRLDALGADVAAGARDALRALDVELDNVREAWRWHARHGTAEALRRIGAPLQAHLDHRGRHAEALALWREALDAEVAGGDATAAAWLHGESAHALYRLDRLAEAIESAERALDCLRRAAQPPGLRRRAVAVLGACALQLGRVEDARARFAEQLELGGDDPRSRAVALDHLALCEKRLGRYDESLRLSLDSLVEHRRSGHGAGVALCLNNLANLLTTRQRFAEAEVHLREALAICERDGLVGTLGHVALNLSALTMERGDLDAAGGFARRALEATQASGNRSVGAWVQLQLARLALRRGDLDAARRTLVAGAASAIELGVASLRVVCAVAFAELLRADGRAAPALAVLAVAIGDPATSALERDEVEAMRRRWDTEPGGAAPPALALDALVRRLVAEAPLAHAPLLTALG